MSAAASEDSPAAKAWRWRVLAALLVLTFAGLRLAYLVNSQALDLAPDEAHYWDWSRHLDWSYYSKGPLVAYLIRVATVLAGPWSEQLIGSAMLAVRLPALLCGCLLLASLYILTVQIFGQERLAFRVVALALTMPAIVALCSLMTIDAPYLCCWGWALVLGHRALFRASAWAWPLTGIVVALGILAKYTMVLWIPSLALFLLTSPDKRRLLLRPGFWSMTLLAGLGAVPILVWNSHHDWITFKHVNTLAGMQQAAPCVFWLGPLSYVGQQCGLLLGFWFVLWLAAMIAHRPWRESDAGLRYLWWLSAPMFAVFLVFSLKTAGGEPNWPATAYLSGMVLTAGWLNRRLQTATHGQRRLLLAGLAGSAVLGLLVNVLIHFSALAHPLLGPLADRLYPEQALSMRRLDPTCRLRGWRTLAAAVDELGAQLRAEGLDPVVAAAGWSLPGELGFYCAGHPQAYSVGLIMGDRRSQYDCWHPNPIADPERFKGRPFILVGGLTPETRGAFAQVDKSRTIIHYVGDRAVNSWTLTVGRDFRGFDPQTEAGRRPRY